MYVDLVVSHLNFLDSPLRSSDPRLVIRLKNPRQLLQLITTNQSVDSKEMTNCGQEEDNKQHPPKNDQSLSRSESTPPSRTKFRKPRHIVDVPSFYESLRPAQTEICHFEQVLFCCFFVSFFNI
jgi:hypothetical protein